MWIYYAPVRTGTGGLTGINTNLLTTDGLQSQPLAGTDIFWPFRAKVNGIARNATNRTQNTVPYYASLKT